MNDAPNDQPKPKKIGSLHASRRRAALFAILILLIVAGGVVIYTIVMNHQNTI